MMNGWPNRSYSHWPINRAKTSLGPPGGKGTIRRPNAMDRFVPTSCSILPKPRQRPRPDSEIYGGQVADTLQQWCAMYFAKRWDRPPFAPELPSKKLGFRPPHLSSCAGPRVQFLRIVGMGDRYFFFLFFLGFFCFPFCSYERPLLRLEMRCS